MIVIRSSTSADHSGALKMVQARACYAIVFKGMRSKKSVVLRGGRRERNVMKTGAWRWSHVVGLGFAAVQRLGRAAMLRLAVSQACLPAEFGDSTLYLGGSMNSWAALEEYAFQYRCDAYYLKVDANVSHDFKIADAAWGGNTRFGASAALSGLIQSATPMRPARNTDAGGTGNLRFAFKGEHTVRLAFAGTRPSIAIGPKTFVDPLARSVTNPVALS